MLRIGWQIVNIVYLTDLTAFSELILEANQPVLIVFSLLQYQLSSWWHEWWARLDCNLKGGGLKLHAFNWELSGEKKKYIKCTEKSYTPLKTAI